MKEDSANKYCHYWHREKQRLIRALLVAERIYYRETIVKRNVLSRSCWINNGIIRNFSYIHAKAAISSMTFGILELNGIYIESNFIESFCIY